ncbi:hypothetical protein [Glycomyces sp. MUSA5-2]|uniref:hypothetical protein n=1 Tax=Glycomyces sp. MUSA5-2 TaxID=2053002 RepID=UPI003008D5A9
MSAATQVLYLAAGVFALTAIGTLWRRDLAAVIRMLAVQGFALASIVAALAAAERSAELAFVAAGLALLRGVLLPLLAHRALNAAATARESRPIVNITASLVAAAALALLAFLVSRPIVAVAGTEAAKAVPVALTVVLLGFLTVTTRRHALSGVAGFLLIDNGITAIAFLTTAGVGLLLEIGISLDVLGAVLVLAVLTGRMRAAFGDTDLSDLKELRD